MKKNLLKVVLVAMMTIAISFSGCTEQTDSGEAKSTSTEQTTITGLTYPLVDTAQGICYDNSELIDGSAEDEAFYGQDAQSEREVEV